MKKLLTLLGSLLVINLASAQNVTLEPIKGLEPLNTLQHSIQPPKAQYPQYKSTYDYKSGNSYTTRKDSLGNTNVDGYNLETGSSWNTQIKKNGDMKGTDKNGNHWNYNKSSKTYYNYGTGTMCTGEGESKVCF